ncbi:MAG: hypothetical protein AAF581_09405 [Planctomycetota bacterium]
MAGRLFSLRARSLLQEQDPDAARAALSAYLVGTELAGVDLSNPGPSGSACRSWDTGRQEPDRSGTGTRAGRRHRRH